MTHVDVVVIGGGVMGASTAWWLARRGRSVVVLERFEHAHRNGSSHGTERIFRLTNADPFWSRMAVEALPLWHELEADAGESLFLTTGHIDVDTRRALQLRADAAENAGVETRWLSPAELRERWPGLRSEEHVLFHAEGGRTNAQATVDAMLRRASELGADVRYQTPVRRIRELNGGVEVETDAGPVTAGTAVVAAAGWTPYILDGVVPGLPVIETSTGQVAFFQPVEADSTWPTFVSPEVYGMSTPDGRVRVGHFRHGQPVHPDQRTFVPDPNTLGEIESWVRGCAPGLDPHNVGELSCLFGESFDDQYVMDRFGQIVVACGFGGHGFKFAPLVGRMLADLACGLSGPVDRFALGRHA
jgi:sarcosine oxidase